MREELELSSEQCARIDEIDAKVYELCKLLTEDCNLPWDMELIGPIADYASEWLTKCGKRVRFPAIVWDDQGEESYIEEYVREGQP